jgi:predicted translin family RNA/ssDNA-binding protein
MKPNESKTAMTESRAEEMAEAAYKAYYSKIMCKGSLPSHAEISINFYLAGMKAMLTELQRYALEIKEAEFPATREQQIVVDKIVRDLGKMMEQDG